MVVDQLAILAVVLFSVIFSGLSIVFLYFLLNYEDAPLVPHEAYFPYEGRAYAPRDWWSDIQSVEIHPNGFTLVVRYTDGAYYKGARQVWWGMPHQELVMAPDSSRLYAVWDRIMLAKDTRDLASLPFEINPEKRRKADA